MVPNGILIVDLGCREIAYSNREMEGLLKHMEGASLRDQICSFLMHNIETGKSADAGSSSSNRSEDSSASFRPGVNLWDYLITLHSREQQASLHTIFKSRHPKRYIQVKTSVIN